MDARVEWRESDGPLPKPEKLVMHGPERFALGARLASGESVELPLAGHVTTIEFRLPPPPQR